MKQQNILLVCFVYITTEIIVKMLLQISIVKDCELVNFLCENTSTLLFAVFKMYRVYFIGLAVTFC